MLTAYIQAAQRLARWAWLAEDQTFSCEIADLPGVWASGATDSDASAELQDALEGWIARGSALHQPFPKLDGVDIRVSLAG